MEAGQTTVRARLGGRTYPLDMLACGWFCHARCGGRVRACVNISVIGGSRTEGPAMRAGRRASSSQSTAAEMAAATTTVSATTTRTATAVSTPRSAARSAGGSGAR
jgi:hypothetical protein